MSSPLPDQGESRSSGMEYAAVRLPGFPARLIVAECRRCRFRVERRTWQGAENAAIRHVEAERHEVEVTEHRRDILMAAPMLTQRNRNLRVRASGRRVASDDNHKKEA